jgi:type II secretory pathway pseudopilin PulG
MVVVAIIGILAGLAIPILSEYRDHAKTAVAKSFGLQVLNTLAAYSARSPRNQLPDVDTCDDLAAVVTENGYYFSPTDQARYCPAGTDIETPPADDGSTGKMCVCPVGLRPYRYPCNQPRPAECNGRPSSFGEPSDLLFTFPLLEIEDNLYLVVSTMTGVEVVAGEDLPTEGLADP